MWETLISLISVGGSIHPIVGGVLGIIFLVFGGWKAYINTKKSWEKEKVNSSPDVSEDNSTADDVLDNSLGKSKNVFKK